MLNAFRHQRGLRQVLNAPKEGCAMPSLLSAGKPRSAQRLSASKRAAPYCIRSLRAQRLSASKRAALRLDCLVEFIKTGGGIKEGCSACSATRHQNGRWPGLFVCSTPFGIKEGCAGRDGRDRSHPASSRCSTPFGIKEGCAGYLRLKRPAECSTPFGIKEGCASRAYSRVLIASYCVLNAFRHQRGLRPPRASWQSAAVYLCSTPFGIKEGCAPRRPAPLFRWVSCSTPFGIKEGCA